VTTARTAMRNPVLTFLPKVGPLKWVIENKLKVSLGKNICFERYIDYRNVGATLAKQPREFYLDKTTKRVPQKKEGPHYTMGDFVNR